MAENLLIRKFKNLDSNSNKTGTLDYWIYDYKISNSNPVCVFVDISDKYDESYVETLYKKESKTKLKPSKPEVIEKPTTTSYMMEKKRITSNAKNLAKEFSEFFGTK